MGVSTGSIAVSAQASDLPVNRDYWIHSKQWDLTFIILSASLVTLPMIMNIVLHNFAGFSQQ